ncbi:3-deoxy-7-phosphoheptulonate synthase [Streptomyces sp. NPDC055025]
MTRTSEAAHGEVRGGNTREPRLADRLAAALDRPAAQQPEWPDPVRARTAVEPLRTAPPIVAESETVQLSEQLAAVARGQAFPPQSGDRAETFAETTESHLRANLGLLKRMSPHLARAHGHAARAMTLARRAYAQEPANPHTGLPSYLRGTPGGGRRSTGQGLGEADLSARYRTARDPRLNEEQSMELAFTVADLLAEAIRPAARQVTSAGPGNPR